MGFHVGKRLRHVARSVSHAARSVAKPVARVVPKSVTNVATRAFVPTKTIQSGVDVSKKVTTTLHPLTSKYGKFLGTVYGVGFGGIVGAAAVARNKKLGGGTGAKVGRAAIQIEKPLAGVAGGLIAGGIGSAAAGELTNLVSGDTGTTTNDALGDRLAAADAGPGASTSSVGGTAVVFVVIGAVVFVGILVAVARRRK